MVIFSFKVLDKIYTPQHHWGITALITPTKIGIYSKQINTTPSHIFICDHIFQKEIMSEQTPGGQTIKKVGSPMILYVEDTKMIINF